MIGCRPLLKRGKGREEIESSICCGYLILTAMSTLSEQRFPTFSKSKSNHIRFSCSDQKFMSPKVVILTLNLYRTHSKHYEGMCT